MSVSPEIIAKVAEWRQKALDKTLTQEECREAISYLRADRMATPVSATKAKKAPADSGSLLGELGL